MTLYPRSSKFNLTLYSTASVIVVALVTLLAVATSFAVETVRAQDPEPTGYIKEITPSVSSLSVNQGETVTLSVNVIGVQDVPDQSLGSDVVFSWSATGGELPANREGNTSVRYRAPDSPGRYTVSVSAGSNCRGTCSTSFTITVRRPGEIGEGPGTPVNPPGPIPTVLDDSDGNQYEVFTPEAGGTFNGEGFSINAEPGVVPNAEFIGVRMYENGPASNAGMSGHRFTLSGTKYTVAVIDSARAAASSYRLNDVATICVPVPNSLLGNIADVQLVGVSDDGVSLTAMSSTVRVVPSLTVCGYTSTIPVNVAAAIPGTPPALPDEPEIEPAPVLPATGGTSPTSPLVMVWALLIGVVLIAASSIALAKRRQEPPTL